MSVPSKLETCTIPMDIEKMDKKEVDERGIDNKAIKSRPFHALYELKRIIVEILQTNEPCHDISNNVVCATSKCSDQPAQKRSLTRAFACDMNII